MKGDAKYGESWTTKAEDLARVSHRQADSLSYSAVAAIFEQQQANIRRQSGTRGRTHDDCRAPPQHMAVRDRHALLWQSPEVKAAMVPPESIHSLLRLALPEEDRSRLYQTRETAIAKLYSDLLRLRENDKDRVMLMYVLAARASPRTALSLH